MLCLAVVHRRDKYCSYDTMCMQCLYLIFSLQDVSIPDLIKQLDILGDNGVSSNGRYFPFTKYILYNRKSEICNYVYFLRYLLKLCNTRSLHLECLSP